MDYKQYEKLCVMFFVATRMEVRGEDCLLADV